MSSAIQYFTASSLALRDHHQLSKPVSVGCLLVPPAPVVTAIDWSGRLFHLFLLSLLFWKLFGFGPRYVWATLNFGKLLINFLESISISSWDLRFHQNMAGCGTPQQSRPMRPHIWRALPTTHYLVLIQASLLDMGLLIGFRSSSAEVADSRIPKFRSFFGV